MGIAEKLANAKKTNWISEGLSESEVKTIVELAKISAQIERCRLEMDMTQKEFAEYMDPIALAVGVSIEYRKATFH